MTYDVEFTQGSFNSVDIDPNTPLTTTPWFGDATLANDLANALQTAEGSGGGVVSDVSGFYNFA